MTFVKLNSEINKKIEEVKRDVECISHNAEGITKKEFQKMLFCIILTGVIIQTYNYLFYFTPYEDLHAHSIDGFKNGFNRERARFAIITTLIGQYFNASDEKILQAKEDVMLWYIIIKAIHNENFHCLYEVNSKTMTLDECSERMNQRVKKPSHENEKITSKKILQLYQTMELYNDEIQKLENSRKLWNIISAQKQLDISNLRNNLKLESNNKHAAVPERLSNDTNYILYDMIIVGDDYETNSKNCLVTLTTQTSIDRLNFFLPSAKNWNGIISLAVFLKGPLEYFLFRGYVSYLKRCYPEIYNKTAFSLAAPFASPIPRGSVIQTKDFDELLCFANTNEINEKIHKNINESKEWLKVNWYPQNMMRNLATKNARTPYHLTLDVDIIPSPKMSASLNKFLANNSTIRHPLVIPTYEISKKVEFPPNKAALVALKRKGQAQFFHKDIFLPNQNSTDFAKWEKIHDTFEDVKVIHEVDKFSLYYEPFFIEHNSSPLYNESFVGYGFTRSSHAFEMYLKNRKFSVLSPVFTFQIGLQKVKHWSTERERQNEYNRRLFEQFVGSLNEQYNVAT